MNKSDNPMAEYLAHTPFFDYEHPKVAEFVQQALSGVGEDHIERAVALYLHTRDQITYNPYVFESRRESFSASHVIEKGTSYCVPKAILLGAAARSVGIPSRLGLADVKNHISSPQLINFLQNDIFSMHGYIELYLNEQWVKATPAFDKALCKKMNVAPLDFDGVEDSIFHEYTESGDQHMEYLKDHGTHADVPLSYILSNLQQHYPHLFDENGKRELLDSKEKVSSLEADLLNE